jgi:hypothetical protein
MRGFGRHMGRLGVIERAGMELRQRRHCGGADEPVQQHRNFAMPRGERRAEDGGELATAERGCDQQRIARAPLVDLGMRLGEGSGAALAVSILRAALACHTGMATFAEAGVANKPH